MTKMRRISTILIGLLLIIVGILVVIAGSKVYKVIIFWLGITLIVSGIRSLIYYFSMARHMVGGRTVLYRAVIILDIGLFTTSLTNGPLYFMVLYLAGMHGFAGAIDILRALESRKLQTKSWKLTLSQGIINMGIAGVCLTFIGTMEISVLVYGLGLIYSGVMRVIQAFRKTEVIYIQ